MNFSRMAVMASMLAASLTSEHAAVGAPASEVDAGRVERLLGRLDRVAALYRDSALRFSCRERITYYPGTPDVRTYLLDYMYVDDEAKGLHDFRSDARAGGRKGSVPREVSLAELGLPSVVLRAYSAVFIFERSKRDTYRFAFERTEPVLGRDADVIRFESVPPYQPDYNDWFGLAWIDRQTSQLLKMDAMKARYHEKKQLMEAEIAGTSTGRSSHGNDYFIESVLTEFGIEEHGMRFPSRVVTSRSHFEVEEHEGVRRPVEHQVFRVEQVYSKYSFYGVRTYEQIRDFVNGPIPPARHR